MSQIYKKIQQGRLYILDKRISRVENLREEILSKIKPDIFLQSLFGIGKEIGKQNDKLDTFYESRAEIQNSLEGTC